MTRSLSWIHESERSDELRRGGAGDSKASARSETHNIRGECALTSTPNRSFHHAVWTLRFPPSRCPRSGCGPLAKRLHGASASETDCGKGFRYRICTEA